MATEAHCRVCGCTDLQACPGGCHWVEPDLCSACAHAPLPRDPADDEPPPPPSASSRGAITPTAR